MTDKLAMRIPTQVGGSPHKGGICGRCKKFRKILVWWNKEIGAVCRKCDLELMNISK